MGRSLPFDGFRKLSGAELDDLGAGRKRIYWTTSWGVVAVGETRYKCSMHGVERRQCFSVSKRAGGQFPGSKGLQ